MPRLRWAARLACAILVTGVAFPATEPGAGRPYEGSYAERALRCEMRAASVAAELRVLASTKEGEAEIWRRVSAAQEGDDFADDQVQLAEMQMGLLRHFATELDGGE